MTGCYGELHVITVLIFIYNVVPCAFVDQSFVVQDFWLRVVVLIYINVIIVPPPLVSLSHTGLRLLT